MVINYVSLYRPTSLSRLRSVILWFMGKYLYSRNYEINKQTYVQHSEITVVHIFRLPIRELSDTFPTFLGRGDNVVHFHVWRTMTETFVATNL